MGNAVTAIEKAAVDSILRVAEKTENKMERAELVDLLFWCRQHGFLTDTS